MKICYLSREKKTLLHRTWDTSKKKELNPRVLFDLFYCSLFYRFSWADAFAFISLHKSYLLTNNRFHSTFGFWGIKHFFCLNSQIEMGSVFMCVCVFVLKFWKWDFLGIRMSRHKNIWLCETIFVSISFHAHYVCLALSLTHLYSYQSQNTANSTLKALWIVYVFTIPIHRCVFNVHNLVNQLRNWMRIDFYFLFVLSNFGPLLTMLPAKYDELKQFSSVKCFVKLECVTLLFDFFLLLQIDWHINDLPVFPYVKYFSLRQFFCINWLKCSNAIIWLWKFIYDHGFFRI